MSGDQPFDWDSKNWLRADGVRANRCARWGARKALITPDLAGIASFLQRFTPHGERCEARLADSRVPAAANAISILHAHGFATADIVELAHAKLATATAERIVAASRKMEVATVRITDQGRRVLEKAKR